MVARLPVRAACTLQTTLDPGNWKAKGNAERRAIDMCVCHLPCVFRLSAALPRHSIQASRFVDSLISHIGLGLVYILL